MTLRVAQGARLIARGLVMEGRCSRYRVVKGNGVALQAKKVHLAHAQQPRIGGSVRIVAAHTAFGFDRDMLEDKWALLVRMAAIANRLLVCGSAQLTVQESAVRIVAIGALDQAFVYAVMKGFRKIGPPFQVAAVTERRLLFLQQQQVIFRMVLRVAAQAGDAIQVMYRALKIGVFLAVLMAREAPVRNFCR